MPALAGKQLWMYGIPFDVNADGKQDLVLGSKGAGATVGWLQRPAKNPRDLSGWTYRPLYDAGWIMSLIEQDVDHDGDSDVILTDRKGASRGLKWVQHFGPPGLSDDSLQDHIRASYDMVVAGLTRKKRAELGL